MLYSEWLETWLMLYKNDIRDNTKRMYRIAVKQICTYADFEMSQMEAETLLRLRAWQIRRAASAPRAAQIERTVLIQSLRKAASLSLSPRFDWTEALPAIDHRAAETAILDGEQLRRYMAEAMESGEPCAVLLLLCCCGLRRCEALGARWEDWSSPVLYVRGQRVRGEWQPPKTAAGNRALVLPSPVADLINQQPRRIRCPYIVDASEKMIRGAHARIMEAAGLEGVTLHGLRHSFATLCASGGYSLKMLQNALGHSKIQLTADLYAGHKFPPSTLPALVLRDVV